MPVAHLTTPRLLQLWSGTGFPPGASADGCAVILGMLVPVASLERKFGSVRATVIAFSVYVTAAWTLTDVVVPWLGFKPDDPFRFWNLATSAACPLLGMGVAYGLLIAPPGMKIAEILVVRRWLAPQQRKQDITRPTRAQGELRLRA